MTDRPPISPGAPEPMDDLAQRLRGLEQHLAFPPTPDLAASVRAELDRVSRPPVTTTTTPGHARWRQRQVAVAAILIILVALSLAVPPARAVVAGWLDRIDLPGIRIEVTRDGEPTAEPASAVGTTLLLGERVSLPDAATQAGFPLKVPGDDTLGGPDEVYVRQVEGGALVSLLYLPRPGLPEIGTTGVGALLMQFHSTQEIELMVKGVREEEPPVTTRIGDDYGYWIRNGRLILFPDPADPLTFDNPAGRPSGNVLLWQDGAVTYRLETGLAREPAVAVAETLVHLPSTPAATDLSSRHNGCHHANGGTSLA